MRYGVKVIHTHTIGENDRRIYEELILMVDAESFDHAYEKAEIYMNDAYCEYQNTEGETVKTLRIEATDCFLISDDEREVQEVYSSFHLNKTDLSEDEYYDILSYSCDEQDLTGLKNKDFS